MLKFAFPFCERLELNDIEEQGARPALIERIFPYRGAWHLPWVIARYFRGTLPAMKPTRLFNAFGALLEMKLQKTHVHTKPFVLRIEPCNVCNLRCPLCACGAGTDPRPKGFMTLDDFMHIIDQGKKTAMILRLDGMGESTLHPAMFEMIRIAKSRGLSITLNSNFNTPASELAEKFIDSGLDRLVVDVDGSNQELYQRYRIEGDLDRVVANVKRLVALRKERKVTHPIIEIQAVDFGWNHHDMPSLRKKAHEWGTDKFIICAPDSTSRKADFNPDRPRRCFWLWTTLGVRWNLDYCPCSNAWSLPWPGLNMREVPLEAYWNHVQMREARQYNLNKVSRMIAEDATCKCNRCYEMLASPLTDAYFCE